MQNHAERQWPRVLLQGAPKITYNFLAFVCLAFAFWFVHESLTGGMLIAFSAFAIIFIMGNFPSALAELTVTATGIKVKLREVQQVVEKATATLDQLRSLALIMASGTLEGVQQAGRLGDFAEDHKQSIRAQVLDLLRQLRCSDMEIESVQERWHRYVEFDYAFFIRGGARIIEGVPSHLKQRERELGRGGIAGTSTPDEIESFLKEAGVLTDERRDLLRDYRHYREHRRHRRPEVWLNLWRELHGG